MTKQTQEHPKFAIIGCGLIGQKRMACLPPGTVTVACDLTLSRAEKLAATAPACRATDQVAEALATPDVGIVIVATHNSALAPTAAQAMAAGKHVLIEKPAALDLSELSQLESLAEKHRVQVRIGYNLRYHPAFRQARAIVESGVLGPLMFIHGRYGHGGRLGYDQEWRADPKLSGGGELIDQGIHLIDLAGWFLGPFTSIEGHAATYFWKMPVDDNAFINLRNKEGKTAWLQASCTEWKNHFSFEIYGRDGKLRVEGLGGSYGMERLSHYQMRPEMGPPDTTIYEYPRGDESWTVEMAEFVEDVRLQRTPVPGLNEAKAALAIVQEIYRKSGYDRI